MRAVLAGQVGHQVPVVAFGHNLYVAGAAEDHAKAGPDEVFVVGQHHLDHDASPRWRFVFVLAQHRARTRKLTLIHRYLTTEQLDNSLFTVARKYRQWAVDPRNFLARVRQRAAGLLVRTVRGALVDTAQPRRRRDAAPVAVVRVHVRRGSSPVNVNGRTGRQACGPIGTVADGQDG
ncbi:hypothetical protein AB0I60_25340 [Actinosynnema sp. NPDC050436]|uniref:hypothetical protein n=1 Tax=Actinosynnema sp. NPDC050436 TaxID=3155659 RepID=UPI0033FB7007